MAAFGIIVGRFGELKEEVTRNGKTICSFSVEFTKAMGDKVTEQVVSIKAFSLKALEKMASIEKGALVECRIDIGGRATQDGKIYNDVTLDFDRIEVLEGPSSASNSATQYRQAPQHYEQPKREMPPMPKQEPQQQTQTNNDGSFEDSDVPF